METSNHSQNLFGTNNLAKIVKHEFQLIPHLGGFFVVKFPVNEKTVEISVGTVFVVPGYKNRTDIVINTGENNWFFASLCNIDKDGLSITGGPGTAGPENIQEIVGQFPAEMVKERMIEYWKVMIEKPLDEKLLSTINKEISGQPRRINLE